MQALNIFYNSFLNYQSRFERTGWMPPPSTESLLASTPYPSLLTMVTWLRASGYQIQCAAKALVPRSYQPCVRYRT